MPSKQQHTLQNSLYPTKTARHSTELCIPPKQQHTIQIPLCILPKQQHTIQIPLCILPKQQHTIQMPLCVLPKQQTSKCLLRFHLQSTGSWMDWICSCPVASPASYSNSTILHNIDSYIYSKWDFPWQRLHSNNNNTCITNALNPSVIHMCGSKWKVHNVICIKTYIAVSISHFLLQAHIYMYIHMSTHTNFLPITSLSLSPHTSPHIIAKQSEAYP